jgi:hypothetical protein
MLDKLDAVIGAFQLDEGSFDLWSLNPKQFQSTMRQTRSRGSAAGKVALVRRGTFVAHGKQLGRVRLPITFKGSVYRKTRTFNIPKDICNRLGIGNGDSIHLIIRTPSGKELFNGRKTLKSGTEIYGTDISRSLTPGATIVVEASQPRLAETDAEFESFDAQERAAGFQSDPQIRRTIEKYAMDVAKDKLSGLGFSNFKNTSAQECYDYTCERDGSLYYVEVKGTQGSGAAVILTKNEVKHGRKYPRHSVAVIVYRVKLEGEPGSLHASGGTSRVCLPWILESVALEPIQYKWTVSD